MTVAEDVTNYEPDRNPTSSWEKLRLEYISTHISMRRLAIKHNVGIASVFKRCREEKWSASRLKFRIRLARKAETKLVNQKVNEWSRQMRLWGKAEKQAEKILNKYEGDDSKTMDPKDLKALTGAISEALKSQKLIKGEPTGEETNISISMQALKFVEDCEKEVSQQRKNAIDVDHEGS